MSERMYKRQIPMIIALVVGMITMADWFIDWGPIGTTTKTLLNFQIILVLAIVGYGFINLFRLHGQRIQKNLRAKNNLEVANSAALLAGLTLFVVVGLAFGSQSEQYQGLYQTWYTPMAAGAYAYMIFYLSSAAYRMLRPRSWETTILLVVAIFTIITNMPMSVSMFPILTVGRSWLTNILVKSTYRAITIGIGLGGILLGMRVFLGLETKYLGIQAGED